MRLLWAYDHPTTRYQEVNFYMDAGLEVIVSLGDPSTLRYDRDYHNEVSRLYPDWRSSVTLPASIVEKLRRISLTDNGGLVSDEWAALINRFIDIIIVPADAPVIEKIMNWYEGYLLYRVMGAPDHVAMLENLAAIERIAQRCGGRLVLAPGLKNVIPFAEANLSTKYVYLNCWVSDERLTKYWSQEESKPRVCTAISYIDFHPFFQSQYDNIIKHINSRPLVVVGKNDKRSDRCSDSRIVGGVPTRRLHGIMAESRVFVDSGVSPEHLIWPPIEAMAMGIPVLYTRWSALSAAGLDEGYSEKDLQSAGMCDDFAAIDAWVEKRFEDFEFLNAVVARQKEIFLKGAFNRNKAMVNMIEFLEHVRSHRTRTITGPFADIALDAEHYRRRAAERPVGSSMGRLDGKEVVKYGRLIRPYEISAQIGQLEKDTSGHFVRRARPTSDDKGCLVNDYLPSLDVGEYTLTIAFDVEDGQGEIGQIGIWAAGARRFSETAVSVRASALGYQEVQVEFVITPTCVGMQREARFYWNQTSTVALRWLRIVRSTMHTSGA